MLQMSSKKDELLLRLTEELGASIFELDQYVRKRVKLPGLGINRAHVEKLGLINDKTMRLKRIQHALFDIQKIERKTCW